MYDCWQTPTIIHCQTKAKILPWINSCAVYVWLFLSDWLHTARFFLVKFWTTFTLILWWKGILVFHHDMVWKKVAILQVTYSSATGGYYEVFSWYSSFPLTKRLAFSLIGFWARGLVITENNSFAKLVVRTCTTRKSNRAKFKLVKVSISWHWP